jgi:hypothetical protein
VTEYFTNWRRESAGVKVTDFPYPRTSSPFELGRYNGGGGDDDDDKARLGQFFKKWEN